MMNHSLCSIKRVFKKYGVTDKSPSYKYESALRVASTYFIIRRLSYSHRVTYLSYTRLIFALLMDSFHLSHRKMSSNINIKHEKCCCRFF